MNNCVNHREKESFSICHVCKKDYCESCLYEGREYYFCQNPECQDVLKSEIEKIDIPEEIICPNCKSELELSIEERNRGKIHCPECESPIDCSSNPPQVLKNEDYQEMLRSLNQGDIGLIKSILEDGDIDYFTLGENFLSVRPLLEPVRMFVNIEQVEIVKELLKDFELKLFGFSSRQDEDFK